MVAVSVTDEQRAGAGDGHRRTCRSGSTCQRLLNSPKCWCDVDHFTGVCDGSVTGCYNLRCAAHPALIADPGSHHSAGVCCCSDDAGKRNRPTSRAVGEHRTFGIAPRAHRRHLANRAFPHRCRLRTRTRPVLHPTSELVSGRGTARPTATDVAVTAVPMSDGSTLDVCSPMHGRPDDQPPKCWCDVDPTLRACDGSVTGCYNLRWAAPPVDPGTGWTGVGGMTGPRSARTVPSSRITPVEPARRAKPCSMGNRFTSRTIRSRDGGPTFGQPNDGTTKQRHRLSFLG